MLPAETPTVPVDAADLHKHDGDTKRRDGLHRSLFDNGPLTVYLSFPARGESRTRVCVKKEALCSSAPLSNPGLTETSSLRAGWGNPELGAGFTGPGRIGNGAERLKRSPGWWAEDKARMPDLDGDTDEREGWEKGTSLWKKVRQKRGWKAGKTQKKRSSLLDDYDANASPGYVPNKKRSDSKLGRKAAQPSSLYTQPDQRVRGIGHSQQTLD